MLISKTSHSFLIAQQGIRVYLHVGPLDLLSKPKRQKNKIKIIIMLALIHSLTIQAV